ncbi:hypothetical protein Tco_1516456 [Tanacetum coccineum]
MLNLLILHRKNKRRNLREFTSEYYSHFRTAPGSAPRMRAVCSAYTEKLECRCAVGGEMFFWVDEMLVLPDFAFAFYTQGLLPRDERPPPGRIFAKCNCGAYPCQSQKHWLSEDADVAEVVSGLNTQEGTESSGAFPHALLAKEETENPPPKSVEAIVILARGEHAATVPPRLVPRPLDGKQWISLSVEEFDTVTASKSALVAQMRAWFAIYERFGSTQKDDEILLLKDSWQSFGDVVKCALARGKAEAVEELHERRLLTVPAAQVPGYNQKAYEELVAAMEAMKLLKELLICTVDARTCRNYWFYLDIDPRDILNPFALEKKSVEESLEAHAIKAGEEERLAGDAAYQVGRSEQSRCHSI